MTSRHPSDEAWERGAEAMARAELTPEILFPDRSPGPELLALEQEVQRITSESRTLRPITPIRRSRAEFFASSEYPFSGRHSPCSRSCKCRVMRIPWGSTFFRNGKMRSIQLACMLRRSDVLQWICLASDTRVPGKCR